MRTSLAILVLVTSIRAAAAQAPGAPVVPSAPAGPGAAAVPIDVFLEQRVAEELAADGTILSRLGVALDIEAVGPRLIVSLVDPATRRAVASTKIDAVPDDREAAVAQVTQVAANLAAQLAGNASPTAAAVGQVLRDERRAREERDAAEYKFRQEALSFGDEIAVYSSGKTTSVRTARVAYQGDMRRRLSMPAFFQIVGRDDLAQSYSNRRTGGWAALVGGQVIGLIGLYLVIESIDSNQDDCPPSHPDFPCSFGPGAGGLAVMGLGLGVSLIGLYYLYNSNPISEGETYDLAARHNDELRRKHGLPISGLTAPRPRPRPCPRPRDVRFAPYATESGGGMLISGRF